MAHTGALAYPTGDDAIAVGPHRGAELPSNLNAVLEASHQDFSTTFDQLHRALSMGPQFLPAKSRSNRPTAAVDTITLRLIIGWLSV